jgi:hypothetical protein
VCQDSIRDANDRKAEGNEHFRKSKWNEALVAYQAGLNRLPKRKPTIDEDSEQFSSKETDYDDELLEQHIEPSSSSGEETVQNNSTDTSKSPMQEEDPEVVQLRSVLSSNVGACHVKLVRQVSKLTCEYQSAYTVEGEFKEAVAACTEGVFGQQQCEGRC